MSAAHTLPAPSTRGTPFKFLDYYEEQDAHRFGGRSREIVEIADAVTHARTLIVYGKSGLGKTSLMLAGVFPELRRRNCLPVHVRTLENPIADVYREVRGKSAGGGGEHAADLDGLIAALRRISQAEPVVLVLDQFEEFFIRFRGQRAAYQAFVKAIGAIAGDQTLRVHVVFSLREEYLADLDDFRANVPSLFDNEYRLRPLTAFGVRETITRPLEIAGIPFDARLVTKLVDRLAKERFDSVMLQILCQEVFDHALERAGEIRLTEVDLRHADDIDGIFRRYLDETTQALPPEQHLQARVVLRALTTQERTKQALRLGDFTAAFYRLSEPEVLEVLKVLEEHRLLRVDQRGSERWYELTHERLVPILEEWLRLDPQFNALLAAYDLIATPSRSGVWRNAVQNLLSTGYLSDVVGPFRERLVLSEREIEFLVWSALYQRHEHIDFWAAQLGAERSRELILDKLDSRDSRFRQGAAFSAGRICRGHSATLKRLFEISLNDPEPAVRREAGLALARAGTAETDADLSRALDNPATRRQALETLADLCAAKADVRAYRRWYRFRAWRIARARMLQDKRLLLGDAGKDGAVGGLQGSVGWTLSVALVYGLPLSFIAAADEGDGKLFWFLLILGIALLMSIGLGGLLAVFVSRSAAARMLLTQDEHFGKALWRSKAFHAVPALWLSLVAAIVLYAWLAGGDFSFELAGFAGILLPVAYWQLVPLNVRWAQRCLSATEQPPRPLLVALAASAGFPVLIPSLFFKLGGVLPGSGDAGDFREVVQAVSILAIPFSSGLTACLAASLGRVWIHHGAALVTEQPTDQASRGRFHRLAVTAGSWAIAAAALALVLSETGLGIFPWQPSSGTVSPDSGPLWLNPGAAADDRDLPRIQYRRFHVGGGDRASHVIAELKRVPEHCYATSRLDGRLVGENGTVLLVTGGHELAFSVRNESCEVGISVIEPVAPPPARLDKPGAFAWIEWQPADQTPTPNAGAGDEPGGMTRFKASVAGKAKPNEPVFVSLQEPLIGPRLGQEGTSAIATCAQNPGVSVHLNPAVQGIESWLPLGARAVGQACVIYPDAQGNWNLELALELQRPSLRDGDDASYRSLAMRLSSAASTEDLATSDRQRDFAFKNLTEAKFRGAALSGARFSRAVLSRADLGQATLSSITADFADLSEATLERAVLDASRLDFADLRRANLTGASFERARLRRANFEGATIAGRVDFSQADLTGSKLSGLSRTTETALVLFRDARLRGSDLSGLDARGFDFERADLTGADFTGARLEGALGLARLQLESACGSGSVLFEGRKLELTPCTREPLEWREAPPLGACLEAPRTPLPDVMRAERFGVARAPDCRSTNFETLVRVRDGKASWSTAPLDGSFECSCTLDPVFLDSVELASDAAAQ